MFDTICKLEYYESMKKTYPLVKNLVSAGFSENYAKVYISLLELGKGTVSQIARAAGINRTTGYDILDNLVSRGLVQISGKEPKQEYSAESPDKIEKTIQEQIEKDQENLKAVQAIIPELKSMHNVAGRPQIRFYEGTEGLMEVYEDTLTSHETIRGYAAVEDMHKALPNYFPLYYKRRAEKGIFIRGIFPTTPMSMERATHDKDEARESAFIPADKYYFSPEIDVYDNKVMIASWKEKLGIIIESAEIADAMKKIYDLAWEEAKRLDKERREKKD